MLAGLLHAGWNAAAHSIPDRRAGQALLALAGTVLAVPVVLLTPLPSAAAWPFILGSTATHLLYGFSLLRSYRLGEFGHTYPLARAMAPLLVVAVGVAVLGQHLDRGGWIGVILLCGGISMVAVAGPPGTTPSHAATRAAAATGVCIATYTLIDGVGVQHSQTAFGYLAWIFVLQGPIATALLAASRGTTQLIKDCRPYLVAGLASGAVSLVAYGAVIWAQARAPGHIGTIAATREIGIVFAALIGRVAFREPLGMTRILGAAMAFTGIAALNG